MSICHFEGSTLWNREAKYKYCNQLINMHVKEGRARLNGYQKHEKLRENELGEHETSLMKTSAVSKYLKHTENLYKLQWRCISHIIPRTVMKMESESISFRDCVKCAELKPSLHRIRSIQMKSDD